MNFKNILRTVLNEDQAQKYFELVTEQDERDDPAHNALMNSDAYVFVLGGDTSPDTAKQVVQSIKGIVPKWVNITVYKLEAGYTIYLEGNHDDYKAVLHYIHEFVDAPDNYDFPGGVRLDDSGHVSDFGPFPDGTLIYKS